MQHKTQYADFTIHRGNTQFPEIKMCMCHSFDTDTDKLTKDDTRKQVLVPTTCAMSIGVA